MFFVAVLPQFRGLLSAGAVRRCQLAILGGASRAAIALTFDSASALAAGAARGWFASRPRRMFR